MGKLSKIFESVGKFDRYETDKRKYFSEKLKESFYLKEGISENGYTVDDVEKRIFSEATRYGSKEKSIKFVKDIEREILLDEGFMDAAKAAGSWVKDKVKKVINKVKDWWAGKIGTAFKNFEAKIKPLAEKMQQNRKPLNQSLEIFLPKDYSYMFENDLKTLKEKTSPIVDINGNNIETDEAPTDTSDETPSADADVTDVSDDESDGDANTMIDRFFKGKRVESGKKTGSTQKNIKFYAITKSGTNSTLWVGPTNDIKQMKVVMSYMKPSGKVFMNLSTELFNSELQMRFISDVFSAIKNNPTLNPKGEYVDVVQAGKKVTLKHNNKNVILIPGKLLIIGVGVKASLPIKVKTAVDQATLMNALGIKPQTDDAPLGGVNTDNANTGVDDGKPVQGEDESDVDFQARMDDWSKNKDDNDFGDDEDDAISDVAPNVKLFSKTMAKIGHQKSDPALLEKLGVSSEDVWNGFLKFSETFNNDIVSILKATNASSNHNGMTSDEYLAYAGTLEPVLDAILTDEKLLSEQPYEKESLKKFLLEARNASTILSSAINVETIKSKDNPEASKLGSDEVGNPASDTTSDMTNDTTQQSSNNSEISKDDLINQIDKLSDDELQYILSKVEQ